MTFQWKCSASHSLSSKPVCVVWSSAPGRLIAPPQNLRGVQRPSIATAEHELRMRVGQVRRAAQALANGGAGRVVVRSAGTGILVPGPKCQANMDRYFDAYGLRANGTIPKFDG